jgi:hypothetical protein
MADGVYYIYLRDEYVGSVREVEYYYGRLYNFEFRHPNDGVGFEEYNYEYGQKMFRELLIQRLARDSEIALVEIDF